MSYIHSAHDFTVVIHLCIIACALLLGSTLRSKVGFLRKYLIPAPMVGGVSKSMSQTCVRTVRR
ncbi:MAG: hypothetical protein J5599_00300 [Spirochaetales bacterium]|nr:hypothetical protein [Spirochaetales bacterium]